VLTVSTGSLAVYCGDSAAVRAFAAAWAAAATYAVQVRLPRVFDPVVPADTEHAGVLLRVSGSPAVQRVNGIPAGASPDGLPHVRVTLGSLVVRAYDRRAVTDLATAWAEAAGLAGRLWPEPDAFDRAERAVRDRIARRGAAAVPVGS
jgi:hypothetical protein